MLIAILKINILLVLFSMVYYLALRKLTFYQLNRWYFLLAISCSVAYPFLNLSSFLNTEQQAAISGLVPAAQYDLAQHPENIFSTRITGVFLTGVLVMALRLCRQFISLYILHKKSTNGQLHDVAVRLMSDKANPFSFGKHIYINPDLHSSHEQKTILAHEKIHVQQWHTLDIMLAESLLLCCWFNPAAWFMSRAIRENLEFIADEAVLEKGIDRKMYQYSLLQVSTGLSVISIANEFTLQDIKKRIQMMNGQQSSRFRLVSYSAFPLLLVVALLFTVSATKTKVLLESLTTTIEDTVVPANNNITIHNSAIINAKGKNQPSIAKKTIRKKIKPVATKDIAANYTLDNTNTQPDESSISKVLAERSASLLTQQDNMTNLPESNIRTVKGFPIVVDDNAVNKSTTPGKKLTGVSDAQPQQTNKDQEPIIVTGYGQPRQR